MTSTRRASARTAARHVACGRIVRCHLRSVPHLLVRDIAPPQRGPEFVGRFGQVPMDGVPPAAHLIGDGVVGRCFANPEPLEQLEDCAESVVRLAEAAARCRTRHSVAESGTLGAVLRW